MADHTFYLKSGTKLNTIRDLADHFPEINPQDFEHHTKQGRNDFATWLSEVFKEHELAAQLEKCTTKEQFQTVIYNHLIQQGIMPKKEQKPDPEREEIVKSPEKFIEYHNKDAVQKDKIADRFDEIHQRFQDSLHPEVPKEIENKIEELQESYADLRRKISEARKEGKNPLIVDFVLRPFQSKLRYAIVTQNVHDFKAAESIIADAKNELADAIAFKEVNVRKEIEALIEGT